MNDRTPEKPPRRPLQLTSDNSRRVRITRRILRLIGDLVFVKTTCKVTVTGLERFPRTGPTIMIFNHANMVDPIMAGAPVRFRDNIPIGKEELSHRIPFNWIIWGWDSIPIRRGELDMTALRRALMVLESSDFLTIAPEGHRNPDGLRTPKEGFVMLAARANAVVVPCGVSGAEKFTYNIRRLRRTPVTVNYGRPLRLKGKITRQQYMEAAHEFMYQIAALVAPDRRGDYADLSRATMNLIEYAD